MTRQLSLLQSPAFLLSLGLLLLNDFYLKGAFPGLLTGKLSDFAGLFAFALFWIGLFPAYRKSICWGIALFFVYWKTPFSQPLIEGWNSLTGLHYARVVDYTDYLALPVLILAYRYSLAYAPDWKVRVPYAIPFSVAVFAFLATSEPDEYDRFLVLDETYELPYGKNEFVPRVDAADSLFIEHGLPLSEGLEADTVNISYYAAHCGGYQWADIVLIPRNDSLTNLQVIGLYYCTDDQQRRPLAKAEFERQVIDKID
ncbi:hypothetical protein [Phaeodactylibacter xiamenensis]|uniref:hypothetical protein n=1 Tax=Phaeodactylibacter xiamenensis TaxID=1524460 RepID=UPI003BAC81A9